MLGYFGIYAGDQSDRIRSRPQIRTRIGWLLGRLPHEIGRLNAR
jgi:hypothetical protein